MSHEAPAKTHFIRQIIDEDIAAGRMAPADVHTRFPPEPNGYLHIGHAKSICLNFGIARDYGGRCNLRFDDTNPTKEDIEFVESIEADVRWLGFDWEDRQFYASDYFERLYAAAEELIGKGLAYVDDLTAEQIREYRGTLTEAGRDSPYRNRSVDENLALFRRMRAGEFADGSHVLRAKIDMASPNMNLRDPTLYRIRHEHHHQTGDAWCIYPMYDFAHALSDAFEGITHSICTLEFEDHRPLYDWCVENVTLAARPRQYEFSRLTLQYAITSKRRLTQLVKEGIVDGWDDPRMPTIAGLRRRGVPPAAIREFCERIGVTKSDNAVEMEMFEACVREELDRSAPRRMVVLRPLKVTLTNWPADRVDWLSAASHPKDESFGSRDVPFCGELYIDHEDFVEQANKKWKRLVSGDCVRLRNAYVIRCEEVIKDAEGSIRELRCSCYLDSLGVNPDGVKPRGVIHWVSARHGVAAEVRVYERLFTTPFPDREEGNFLDFVNPDSLERLSQAIVEPALAGAAVGERFQFEREGYFCRDLDSGRLVFNRTATLRDSWAKIADKA
ncbi:glutamine--tRNA ligase/YqeY domain fusion protein [Plasticicumulans acidivorans]|uniref:Glutamine--tRNA ligase n=1 Tax=Plasticicumulans acidivorans TaxID=886464 RepID=A0A317MX82_9GAMM|nr:glutamine--tRNA ligase/YqeY domain fusion protein [Plasticicumulans acidivorans]PWV59579.1 glutaminyl-tRNA synthetase [Plasticicumulans acidivorans]